MFLWGYLAHSRQKIAQNMQKIAANLQKIAANLQCLSVGYLKHIITVLYKDDIDIK